MYMFENNIKHIHATLQKITCANSLRYSGVYLKAYTYLSKATCNTAILDSNWQLLFVAHGRGHPILTSHRSVSALTTSPCHAKKRLWLTKMLHQMNRKSEGEG